MENWTWRVIANNATDAVAYGILTKLEPSFLIKENDEINFFIKTGYYDNIQRPTVKVNDDEGIYKKMLYQLQAASHTDCATKCFLVMDMQ